MSKTNRLAPSQQFGVSDRRNATLATRSVTSLTQMHTSPIEQKLVPSSSKVSKDFEALISENRASRLASTDHVRFRQAPLKRGPVRPRVAAVSVTGWQERLPATKKRRSKRLVRPLPEGRALAATIHDLPLPSGVCSHLVSNAPTFFGFN